MRIQEHPVNARQKVQMNIWTGCLQCVPDSLRSHLGAEVSQERRRLFDFAQRVRDGRWLGCRGDRIVDVINIGIGGSAVGAEAGSHALEKPLINRRSIHLRFSRTETF